jgi:hypothetical protein
VVQIADTEEFSTDLQRPETAAFLRGDLVYSVGRPNAPQSEASHATSVTTASDGCPGTEYSELPNSREEVARVNVEQLTSLPRMVDPRYPSNRLMLVGAGVTGLAVGLAVLLGADLKAGPLAAAVGIFLAWAMARELDPDRPTSAAIAMPISLVLVLTVGPPALLVTFGVLLGLRITAGTVGTPLRPLDFVTIVGLSAALGTSMVGAVGAAAMIIGVLVAEERRQRGIAIAAASAVTFIAVALLSGVEFARIEPTAIEWITVGLAITATLLVIPAATPTSETDRHTGTVNRDRVTGARLVAGLAILAGFAVAGASGVIATAATVAAALIGTAVHHAAGRLG